MFLLSSMEKIVGVVERITFQNEENGWTVLKASLKGSVAGELDTILLHQEKIFIGQTIEFTGEWVMNARFGRQFKAIKALEIRPRDIEAIRKYLGSGMIYGVGPKISERIVNHFGKETLDVFESNMERLTEVHGIAQSKLESIKESWEAHRHVRELMIFLQAHEINAFMGTKIYKTYGPKSLDIIRENPYRLARDVYGIGFLSADKMALKFGMEAHAPQRIEAAILHSLQTAKEDGHCYLLHDQIKVSLEELIGLSDEGKIEQALQVLLENELIRQRNIKEKGQSFVATYLKKTYFEELMSAKQLAILLEASPIVEQARVKSWLERFNQTRPFPLSDEQMGAVAAIVGHGVSILTGGPGCGKTTTTQAVVKLLLAMKKRVCLCAPTGRAAQRMGELIGLKASTIHRLLVWEPRSFSFQKNEEEPLDTDVVIVDEVSMLDISLFYSLLRAIKQGTQVLFIGDKDQLPSVGAGNVLADMIASQLIPVFTLTKVFRQGQESQIIANAHAINRGEFIQIPSPFEFPEKWDEEDCLFIDTDELTSEQIHFIQRAKKHLGKWESEDELDFSDLKSSLKLPKKFLHFDWEKLHEADSEVEEMKAILKKVHPHSSLQYGFSAKMMIEKLLLETIPKYFPGSETQILSPMIRGSLGSAQLNMFVQQKLNAPTRHKKDLEQGGRTFREGDRVIQKRNNYELQVFNGDIGRIKRIDLINQKLFIDFSDNREVEYGRENFAELDLAYAITIHKSQGSEFDVVIIPVLTQHFIMLYRNLIYTALTRAKKMAIFLGTRKAFFFALKNIDSRQRQSYLKQLISFESANLASSQQN